LLLKFIKNNGHLSTIVPAVSKTVKYKYRTSRIFALDDRSELRLYQDNCFSDETVLFIHGL
jgi:hypothetical protein